MSKVQYIEGDLFASIKEEDGHVIIPHVCNDIGVMGAGFVIPLSNAFPRAKSAYLDFANGREGDTVDNTFFGGPNFELGVTQMIPVRNWVTIANMIAQHGVGGPRPLRYNALATCMDHVAIEAMYEPKRDTPFHIAAPLFGAGLAGGDWNLIEKLIEDCWLERGLTVRIYYMLNRLPAGWTPPKE